MDTIALREFSLPKHKTLSLLVNPHHDANLSVADFIASQQFPVEVTPDPDELLYLLSGEAKQLWMAVWFEEGDKERNECNVLIARDMPNLVYALDYYAKAQKEEEESLNVATI